MGQAEIYALILRLLDRRPRGVEAIAGRAYDQDRLLRFIHSSET